MSCQDQFVWAADPSIVAARIWNQVYLSAFHRATIAALSLGFAAPCAAQNAENAIAMHIAGPVVPVRLDDAVVIQVAVKNTSANSITMYHRISALPDFDLWVGDENGNEPPLTCYGQAVFGGHGRHDCAVHLWGHPRPPEILAPGDTFTEVVDLSDLFEFQTGTYTVRAVMPTEPPSITFDEKPVSASSNAMSIAVFRQRVRWSG